MFGFIKRMFITIYLIGFIILSVANGIPLKCVSMSNQSVK